MVEKRWNLIRSGCKGRGVGCVCGLLPARGWWHVVLLLGEL